MCSPKHYNNQGFGFSPFYCIEKSSIYKNNFLGLPVLTYYTQEIKKTLCYSSVSYKYLWNILILDKHWAKNDVDPKHSNREDWT